VASEAAIAAAATVETVTKLQRLVAEFTVDDDASGARRPVRAAARAGAGDTRPA
jgi:hypothetical protein